MALRQAPERCPSFIVAEIAQQAIADTLVRHGPYLLLDGLDRVDQIDSWTEPQWIEAGEPANGTAQVDILEKIFATMSFETHQHLGLTAPAADHPGQGRQQQIIDLRAIGRRSLLQQTAGPLSLQPPANVGGMLQLTSPMRVVAGQVIRQALKLCLPVGKLRFECRPPGMFLHTLGPDLE